MNPSSWFDTGLGRRLQVVCEDGDRVFCRGWRDGADGDQNTVLVVLPAAEHPTRDSLDRLRHEYALSDDLDDAWAVRPLELVHERGQTMLVLRDPGGEPLDGLLGPPMEVGRFLRLAVALSGALGRLHQRGLVHKDIKPTNILVNSATGQVWLTGFGIASRLPREHQLPEPPEFIAGTLPYMAPEQTGRMNRSIDSRSDLYSLGIAFYEMLTGTLPFAAADPMEWVHCHIARRPAPPDERVAGVPGPLAAIVTKLLAKNAICSHRKIFRWRTRCREFASVTARLFGGPTTSWLQSELNQQEYCEAYEVPLKAFGNWRAKFKAEPQTPARKALYRRGGLSHTLSHGLSHDLPIGPIILPARGSA